MFFLSFERNLNWVPQTFQRSVASTYETILKLSDVTAVVHRKFFVVAC